MAMNSLKITALDCALRYCGIFTATYCPHTNKLSPGEILLAKTEKEKDKQIRRNSDDLERARLLHRAITLYTKDADFVIGEVPTGAQSARASLSFGIVIGLYAGLSNFIQVQPTDVKRIVSGRKTASKDEVIAWSYNRFPNLNWLRARGQPDGDLILDNEHMADAIAIAFAGIATEQFKQAIAMGRLLREVAA